MDWSPVRYADRGDVRLAYEQLPGDGARPLLLVMGLSFARWWWPDGFCTALAERGFTVARYDNRDAGESTRIAAPAAGSPWRALLGSRGAAYRVEDMVDDGAAVLDALGCPSAHVAGASMGAALAQLLAVRHPARVRSLTSVAGLPADAGRLEVLRHLRVGGVLGLTRLRLPDDQVEQTVGIARALASPGFPFDEDAARERARRDAAVGPRDDRAQNRQLAARWTGPGIDTIRCPALVVQGDADRIIRPSAGRALARRIPGARLVELPGMGHELPAASWNPIGDAMAELAAPVS